jgi:hypothetical protein
MAKTLASIRSQLEEVQEKRGSKLLLDPHTVWDTYSIGLFVLLAFLACNSLPRMFSKGHPLALPGLIGAVLLAYALLSFNESWVIDFERRRVQLYRSLFKFAWCPRSHSFDDLTQLGVVGSRHIPRNGGGAYWKYGLLLASRQGLLPLFRDLDTSYSNVLELAIHLSQEMGVPLVEPRPFADMAYSAEQHELRYTSGQAVPKDPDERDHADLHGDLTPMFGSRKTNLPEVEVRKHGGRVEFEQKSSKLAQQGCALVGLGIVGPMVLSGAGLFATPEIGPRLFGLLLLLPALAAAWYLLDWMLFPILRQYEYVDGDARQVGVVQDRGKSRFKVSPFDVPSDARVVCVEVVGRTEMRHGISLRQGDKLLYLFHGGHNAVSNREKAQAIAETLGLPLEMRSDLDSPTTED